MALDLLITGFGPFPFVRVNPTDRLARMVARSPRFRLGGPEATALVLETSYRGGLPRLAKALEDLRPQAVLMLGLAARARWIRVERYARGSSSRLHVDASGSIPSRSGSGARPLQSNGGVEPALARLRGAGLVARLSPSAGRYLCDAGYHLALVSGIARGAPTLFVHVPWLRPAAGVARGGRDQRHRPDPVRLAAALAAIGVELALRARRARLRQSPLA